MTIQNTSNLAERVISHIHKLDAVGAQDPENAELHARDAMRDAGFSEPYDPEVEKIVANLIDMGANRMTCLTAACLFLDYKILEERRKEGGRPS